MTASVLTRKGQVTIPKAIRERLGLQRGVKLLFLLRENEITLKPLQGSILDLKGSVRPKRRPEDFDRVRRSVRQAVARRTRKGG
jgi:AbrB family looped-hinge helix DNA binding protein